MSPVVVHHRTPLALWIFAAFWCGGVVVGTVTLWRDGLPDGATPLGAWVVLFVFWMAAIGLVAFVSSQPMATLRVWPDGRAEILRCWPLKRRRLKLRTDQLTLRLIEDRDSDGDPYFRLQLSAGHHLEAPVSIAEGSRAHCEAVRGRLKTAGIDDVAP